jgi:hypothetical protein
MAFVVLAACLLLPHAANAAQLRTPTGRLSLAPCPGASPDERLRDAILSVHAYVEKYRADAPLRDILDHVDPMLPLEAVRIIKQDRSPLGALRVRRALLRYLTWVRDDPQVKPAIEELVGIDAAKRLERRLGRRDHGDGCDVQYEVVDEQRQIEINEAVNLEIGPVQPTGQCTNVQAMLASVINKGENVIVPSKVIAVGDRDTAKKGIDAQRWDTCSKLWSDTFLVKLNSSNNIEDNGSCSPPDDPNCFPKPGAEVTPFGSTYNTNSLSSLKRPLFEHFTCDGGWCDVRLLLHITATIPVGKDYQVEYDTPEPWKGFPYPPVDQGTVEITSVPAGGGKHTLTVKADKIFGFGDWTTDFAIYFMLRRIEMANYLADLVCCPFS